MFNISKISNVFDLVNFLPKDLRSIVVQDVKGSLQYDEDVKKHNWRVDILHEELVSAVIILEREGGEDSFVPSNLNAWVDYYRTTGDDYTDDL